MSYDPFARPSVTDELEARGITPYGRESAPTRYGTHPAAPPEIAATAEWRNSPEGRSYLRGRSNMIL